MLKAMLPTEVDVKVITKKQTLKNKERITPEQKNMETDQLYIWECVSISETRNLHKLKFEDSNKNNKRTRALENDNKRNNIPRISAHRKEILVEHSDNLISDWNLVWEKLMLFLQKNKINRIALANNDKIFEYINKKEFMNKYNEMQRNNKNEENNKLSILIFKPVIRIINKQMQVEIIDKFHNSSYIGGHQGVKRTINKIKQKYCWKNLSKMVKEYVNQCESCNRNKKIRYTKEKLQITDTPTTSFQVVTMDTVGPLRPAKQYRYILTVQCELTKYVQAIPIETKEAKSIAHALVENIILKFGTFKTIKTDMGTEFVNQIFRNICEILKIQHVTSTPYHHETLGTIERNHRTMNEYLLAFTHGYDWDEWLPYYIFCYNITPHTDTGMTPHELIFGKIINLPDDIINEDPEPIYNAEDYSKQLKWKLQEAHKTARKLLIIAKEKRKKKYDITSNPLNTEVGSRVYLRVGPQKKHNKPYVGPYEVIECDNVNTTIKMNDKTKKVHNNRLKKA